MGSVKSCKLNGVLQLLSPGIIGGVLLSGIGVVILGQVGCIRV